MNDDSRPSGRAARWTRRLLWLLLLAELAWLTAGNAFLRTSWGPSVLARRPEKLQVSWQSAWTPLPGLVRVHRIDVRGRSPKVTWMATADAAWLWVAPMDLLRRRFHVRWLEASALESRAFLARKDPAGQPPIDGFDGLPAPQPRERKHHWRLDFDHVSVDGIRELWFGPLHYVARPESQDDGELVGVARGSFRAQVRGEMSVPRAQVELGPGRAIAGSEVIGAVTRLAFEGHLEPFVPQKVKGVETLRHLSGTFEAATTGGSLGLVDYFFRGAPASVHGTGRLTTILHVERGVLQQGSELDVDNGSVEASYLGWRGEGDGKLEGQVGTGGETMLEVTLDKAEMGLAEVAEKLVVSREVRLLGTADRFDLSSRRPALRVVADLPDSEISDLAQLQAFLPAFAGVEILGGTGTMSGHGELTTEGAEAGAVEAAEASFGGLVSGTIQIRGERVDVRVRGTPLSADLQLDVAVPEGDLTARRLDIGGSRLQLERVQVPGGGKDWWADLRVTEGSVQLPQTGSVARSAIDAQLEAELADSRPLLALVVERRASFRWFERLLTFEDLQLAARFRTAGNGVELRDIEVRDDGNRKGLDKDLRILGQVRFGEAGYDVLLRASMKLAFKNVAAGLQVHDGKIQDIDLRRSLEWYQSKSATFWQVPAQ